MSVAMESLRTLAPAMPAGIESIIHEEWDDLDADAGRMLGWMKETRVFHEFAHGRAPFIQHLRNTWAILSAWKQPEHVCRCGLLHSAYTRPGFYFRYFDFHKSGDRQLVSSVLGADAELLVYKYCAPINLWQTFNEDTKVYDGLPSQIILGEPIPPDGTDLPMRTDPSKTIHLSAKEIAHYLVVMVADIAEQMTPVISYREVYHEVNPTKLWPGSGEPQAGFYHMLSKMMVTAAPYLAVVPPIFDNCTTVISLRDEVMARNAYWKAVQEEKKISTDEQMLLYLRAIGLNSNIGEPHAKSGPLQLWGLRAGHSPRRQRPRDLLRLGNTLG